MARHFNSRQRHLKNESRCTLFGQQNQPNIKGWNSLWRHIVHNRSGGVNSRFSERCAYVYNYLAFSCYLSSPRGNWTTFGYAKSYRVSAFSVYGTLNYWPWNYISVNSFTENTGKCSICSEVFTEMLGSGFSFQWMVQWNNVTGNLISVNSLWTTLNQIPYFNWILLL